MSGNGGWIFHIDGEIVRQESFGGGGPPTEYPGAICIEVDDYAAYTSALHKIVDGVPVEKTDEEKHQHQLPKQTEVFPVIAMELQNSDKTQIPDYPIDDDERAKWKAYRAALRRLSDLPNAVARINAWPQRPDGVDPVNHLKVRIRK